MCWHENQISGICRLSCGCHCAAYDTGFAYWQAAKLRGEYEAITAKTAELQGLAAALEDKTGGGVTVWKQENGQYSIALPSGMEPDQIGQYGDGRYGFIYTWPPARK